MEKIDDYLKAARLLQRSHLSRLGIAFAQGGSPAGGLLFDLQIRIGQAV
jgi:hypothetical protein